MDFINKKGKGTNKKIVACLSKLHIIPKYLFINWERREKYKIKDFLEYNLLTYSGNGPGGIAWKNYNKQLRVFKKRSDFWFFIVYRSYFEHKLITRSMYILRNFK